MTPVDVKQEKTVIKHKQDILKIQIKYTVSHNIIDIQVLKVK